MDHYGLEYYGHRFDPFLRLFEEQKKYRSVLKANLKNTHRFKSYGQNKINSKIMAISLVFWPYFGRKKTTLKEALPMSPQNQWNKGKKS